jgi:DNA-binding transcriptional regulator GbsR (MarR family)
MKTSIKVKSTSFEINKLITTTQLFSRIKLTVSARLVLRCIVDYWNFKISCAYPTQSTISKCTGLSEVAVGKAVKELDQKGLIEKQKKRKRIYYHFTIKFLGYLNLLPKVIYVDTQTKLGKIPQQSLDKNILKENENTLFSNSLEEESEDDEPEEDAGLGFAKATIKHLGHLPQFAKKVKELKEKYNL